MVSGLDEAVGSAARHKKRNTALSCAECRRLKLRCDRKFPCSACIKRGCSQICPDGSLTTGKGNRFVLANTEALHEKIEELSHRVRALEDALGVAHKAISSERHPLLSDELMRIKNPLERDVIAEPPRVQDEEDTIDAVGSLSISHTGRANFYGQTANAWYLLQNEENETPEEEVDESITALQTDLPWLSNAFPLTPVITHETAEQLRLIIIERLPAKEQALYLVNCYFDNASWMYHPITRAQFDESVFSYVYDPEPEAEHDPIESHRLSMLLIVLATGILVDLNSRSHSTHAASYFQLSKAALSLSSILEEPSILSIQALVVMCHYLFLADVNGPRWTLMGIVVKLAQSIGLHRDSSRWKLGPEETQKRRALFWEIYVYDSWQSLTYGRPPSLSTAHIDCKMAHETTKNASGQVEMSFDAWKHRFSSECLSIIHDQVFGARTPSYATVMELDKRVRAYYVPPSLQVPGFGGSSMYVDGVPPSMQLTMQQHVILAIKETTLLYMHRGFFAKALDDHPEDPLSGKYGQSVLCAYRSASSFVALVKSVWSQHRSLTERNWFLFTHVFSCAIVLGSIPTRCPSMGFARSALNSLDQAYELFTQVAQTERARASKVLPTLARLRDRAHATMDEHQSHTRDGTFSAKREPTQDSLFGRVEDEELATLGGKTRLVSPKPQSPSSSRGSVPRSFPSSPATTGPSPSPRTPALPAQAMYSPENVVAPMPGGYPQTNQYSQSPEMVLYGTNDLAQVQQHPQQQQHQQVQMHAQHAHSQPQPQQQMHLQTTWPDTAALSMGYMQQMPMQTAPSNQYDYSGYDYMSAMRQAYPIEQTYSGSSGMAMDVVSPTLADLDSHWRNLMASYSNENSIP
ncbi:hypothetical protein SCHPADRAFT_904359 [Schizopora paradoxa]|uniref:Zn(2)-C6 fungal-type domain-containing protein n=1 Tax=Schizopora paradoxa TaxID=27342 RepID=A0A0H2RMV4_9AGAM|nr:hypothetical protein SCHPADRAFT_904359 [Schizopora paradoxa]